MGPLKGTFVKWQGWMKRIEDDVAHRLIVPRQVYRGFVDAVNGNIDHIEANSGWYYCDFVRQGYAAQVAMGIRRHVKVKDDGSISLMLLLKQLNENARRFTYDFFLEQFPLQPDYVPWQKVTFEQFSDDGASLSERLVTQDMDALKGLSGDVEKTVDKEFAHLDRKPHKNAITFGDLDRCIDKLNRLVCKYRTLFGGGGMETLEPEVLYDWEDIFKVPLDARR